MKIAVIHGSTRKNGNTEYLTYHAVPKDRGTHIYLRDYNIQPIVDERHSETGFNEVHDDHKKLINKMLEHDTIVFSTPIYWYSMSGPMKTFIDRWSQILRDPDFPHFREELKKKKIFLIAVGGDTPQIKGLPLVEQFNYICKFYEMSFEGYVIGKASRPGQIINDHKALSAASMLIEQ
ncbi:flavodoxin family protein [Oceanobacillus halophilus]|uniref:Flavodoxin family protein n=1 Tax=Oceanobacillus halophilus TaxID=930130 RepID=A0A495A1U4_9BACI|nr:flavodoxin family protein [Oceanobacillus halophilus]RKQ33455.1 flavodoxin family protein [Oceanobacillus halophilus]